MNSTILTDSTVLVPGKQIRAGFPFYQGFNLESEVPAYLDSAASAQKPAVVIDRLQSYLSKEHANIHRGAYRLSAEATENYAKARSKVANFIGAGDAREIVFTRGATEAINLVSFAFEKYFSKGDVVLLSLLEHHSNIVPWQLLAKRKGLQIEWVEITEHGAFDLDDYARKLKKFRPTFVSLTALSNSFGSVVPVSQVVDAAHEVGAKILIDAAQAVVHGSVAVTEWGADFVAFSGHKMYGPTGIGALYGKLEHLEYMDPFQGGGDMIAEVTTEGSSWAEVPRRFEAGTPAIGEAIALGTAVDFMQAVGPERIVAHEAGLFEYGFDRLSKEEGVTVYGPAVGGGPQVSILSFNVDSVHPHDLASVADSHNVQLRAGHHCTMPALKRLGIHASARISFGVYNTKEDIDRAVESVRAARKFFSSS